MVKEAGYRVEIVEDGSNGEMCTSCIIFLSYSVIIISETFLLVCFSLLILSVLPRNNKSQWLYVPLTYF